MPPDMSQLYNVQPQVESGATMAQAVLGSLSGIQDPLVVSALNQLSQAVTMIGQGVDQLCMLLMQMDFSTPPTQ